VAAYPEERGAAGVLAGVRRVAGLSRRSGMATALRRARSGALRRGRLRARAGNVLVDSVGELLTPGTSALVAVVDRERAREVERWLAARGANLITGLLTGPVAEVEAGTGH
jgi:hypothetical protein